MCIVPILAIDDHLSSLIARAANYRDYLIWPYFVRVVSLTLFAQSSKFIKPPVAGGPGKQKLKFAPRHTSQSNKIKPKMINSSLSSFRFK